MVHKVLPFLMMMTVVTLNRSDSATSILSLGTVYPAAIASLLRVLI